MNTFVQQLFSKKFWWLRGLRHWVMIQSSRLDWFRIPEVPNFFFFFTCTIIPHICNFFGIYSILYRITLSIMMKYTSESISPGPQDFSPKNFLGAGLFPPKRPSFQKSVLFQNRGTWILM